MAARKKKGAMIIDNLITRPMIIDMKQEARSITPPLLAAMIVPLLIAPIIPFSPLLLAMVIIPFSPPPLTVVTVPFWKIRNKQPVQV
jgi:hypothetical protein